MSAPVIPPGGTIVETFKQSFTTVPVDAEKDNAIATTQFLDAAESLTTIFGTQTLLTIDSHSYIDIQFQMPWALSPSLPSSPTCSATSRFEALKAPALPPTDSASSDPTSPPI